MPLTPPTLSKVANGKPADATPVRKAIEYVCSSLEGFIRGLLKASNINWDVTVPPSALPGFGVANGVSKRSGLYSQAMHVQALGLEFARRVPDASMDIPNPGWPAPAYGGFVIPSQDDDAVYFWTHDELNGGWNRTRYGLGAGDAPTHCVASAKGILYVACSGTMKVRQIDTRTGIVSDFVSLASLDPAYTAGALSKIAINRLGTFVYVIAKKTGLANFRFCVQVATSNGAMVEKFADDDLLDVAMLYGSASTSGDATVCVLERDDGLAGFAHVWYENERTWSSGGFSAELAPGGVNVGGQVAMCEFSDRLGLAGNDPLIGIPLARVIENDAIEGAENFTIAGDSTFIGSITALDGSLATDGHRLYWLTSDGAVLAWDPYFPVFTSRHIAVLFVRAGFMGSTFTQGGICFTGSEFVVVGNESGTMKIATFAP